MVCALRRGCRGGLILCDGCLPRDSLQQSVSIRLPPARAVVGPGPVPPPPLDPHGTESVIGAREKPAVGGLRRSRLRATEKVEWIHDRQRYERRGDHRDRVYSETCFVLDTGEIKWGPKIVDLDDQESHGPRPASEEAGGVPRLPPTSG